MFLRSYFISIAGIIQALNLIITAAQSPGHVQERRLADYGSGFINIDCGLSTGSYYFHGSGLYFTSDEKYITSGRNMAISSAHTTNLDDVRYTTVKSFPDGVKNCYTLPVQPYTKYMVRARFMYGNYDGKNYIPGFDLYLGVNFWITITLPSVDRLFASEIIHVPTTNSIDVCLVHTGHGTPFISALELRPLNISAYAATTGFSLRTFNRWDAGPTTDLIQVYYNRTDDPYDRLWFYAKKSSSLNTINTDKYISASDAYMVPHGVLSTAVEQNDGHNLSVKFPINDPTTKLYAYWHFAELKPLDLNQTREFNILVDHGPGYKFGPVRPKYLQSTTVESTLMPLNGSNAFVLSLVETAESNLPPVLNGFELYLVVEHTSSPTRQQDVDGVTAMRNKYGVPRIWQGDPCLPVNHQWDGLNCSYKGNNPPKIISLNLASSNLTGDFPQSLSKLASLNHLNLSNNGFSGKIPEFLARLPSLKLIDLRRNNLTGPVPALLAKKARNKSIILRLEGNPGVCNLYPCEETKDKKKTKILIIALVTFFAVISLLAAICFILFALKKRARKEGLRNPTIKSRNKQFSYSEVVKMTDNFAKILGKGGFGTVYYGTLSDGAQVAVKILNITSSITIKQFCAEAELLTRIHHTNLVPLIGYCDDHTNMALVYECMSMGDLQTYLSARNECSLSWNARLQVAVDSAQGLEYLHSGCRPPIIHRDVKPANILLDEFGNAKISDFGLSRFMTSDSEAVAMTDFAGTRGYLDPEVMMKSWIDARCFLWVKWKQPLPRVSFECEIINIELSFDLRYCQLLTLSEKSDVYAFGVVLLELLTGRPPFMRLPESAEERIHISRWVAEMSERGDISAIVDERLAGDFDANSAWRVLEIAMACMKATGPERPRMSQVVADLKMYKEAPLSVALENESDFRFIGEELKGSDAYLLPNAR